MLVCVSTLEAYAFLPCWELSATIFLGSCHWSIPDIMGKVLLEIANPVEKEVNTLGDKDRWEFGEKCYTFWDRNNDTLLKSAWKIMFWKYFTQYSLLREWWKQVITGKWTLSSSNFKILWTRSSVGEMGQNHPGKVNSEGSYSENLTSQISFYHHPAAIGAISMARTKRSSCKYGTATSRCFFGP